MGMIVPDWTRTTLPARTMRRDEGGGIQLKLAAGIGGDIRTTHDPFDSALRSEQQAAHFPFRLLRHMGAYFVEQRS
jgi:hypothetical protein